MRATTIRLAMVAALLSVGCDDDGDKGSDSGAASADTKGTGSATGTADGWVANWTPCGGYMVDTLYCDDAQTCYVGCGSDAAGHGLFLTTDGGLSWDIAPDETGALFDDFRVHDVHRDPRDGLLYVAGKGDGDIRVVALDTTDGSVTEVYINHPNIDYTMSSANYVRRSDGLELAESLTGGQVVIRRDDAGFRESYADYGGWADGDGWWHNTDYTMNAQVLDLVVVDDQIIGSGSQINVPPAVLLPPRTWEFGTDSDGDGSLDLLWETVSFASEGIGAYDGECWGVAGNADGLAVVCVDQDADRGMAYTIGADWQTTAYDPDNWTETRFDTVVAAATEGGRSTWNEGVCRGPGNRVTVVGRDSQTNDGYVAHSEDGGSAWREVTAAVEAAFGGGFGPITRCMYTADHLMVAGPGLYAYVPLGDL